MTHAMMSSTLLFLQDVVVHRGDGTIVSGDVSPISYFDGGFIMYPLSFCAVAVLVLAARAAWRLQRDGSAPVTGSGVSRLDVDGVLFWGGMSLVLGLLGTAVGIAVAAQSVEAVGVVETRLVWGGIRASLLPTIVGLLYFAVSALVWLGLRFFHRKKVLDEAVA